MRIITGVFFYLMVLLPLDAFAETATVGVNGLVCSFCAQGIKKTFSKQEAVESVEVNMDQKIVSIKIKEGAVLTDEKIKEIVTDAGFTTTAITRTK
jgi:mercuric ion binding protein